MFFRDIRLNIYPVSEIVKITFIETETQCKRHGDYEVSLRDGSTCTIDQSVVSQLMRAGWQFVPSFPGSILLEWKRADDRSNDPFNRMAVLAWAIDEEGALQPVTADGISDTKSWAVLTPEGTVSDQFGGSFCGEQSYLEYLQSDDA
jgi:hypothetical protein